MKNSLFYGLFILILCGTLLAQEDKIVAKVGPVKIYESEFKDRFDLSVHPNLLQKNDQLKEKEEFLHQLIAEKLLSLEAKENSYDTASSFRKLLAPLKDMFVRDALYKKEIKSKSSYTQDEIAEGLKRISNTLKVKFIYSLDPDEIQNIYNQLCSGADFDSLLALRKEFNANPKQVSFGTFDKNIEDSVYNLKPGQFTHPVYGDDGIYILKLVEIVSNPDLKNAQSTFDNVKKIVETRAEKKVYMNYYHNFFKDFRITADKEIFEQLAGIFIPSLKQKYKSQSPPADNKFYLKGSEIYSALNKLSNAARDKVFMSLNGDQVKPEEFIFQLSQDGLYVKELNDVIIRASLSAYIRKFIEGKLLAAKGYREGLENVPEVKKDIQMWEDSYLAKMQMVKMFDSVKVSEDQAYAVYKQNDWKETTPQLVNIAEVLTDSLGIAETVLNQLSKGADIKDLARRYTIRDSVKDKGGGFGYFDITRHGEIGRIASQLKVGDVYGPVKLDEGYSNFKVLSKKDDTISYTRSFEEVKSELVAKITLAKFEKFVNEHNAKLAGKYGVEINEDVLKNIDNVYLNLVVARYMGFGGEIYAVPYTEEYSGWYNIWMKNKSIPQ